MKRSGPEYIEGMRRARIKAGLPAEDTYAAERREKVAELAHEQWSGWMDYLFSKCLRESDGTVTMPAWAVERWTRQMKTPYAELSESEKDSDRIEADKFLRLLS